MPSVPQVASARPSGLLAEVADDPHRPHRASGFSTLRSGSTGSPDGDGALVMVVEDDPRSARLLAAHLQACGHRVEVAHSADEARIAFEKVVPELLLCDVCLPDTDGIEFTRELRSNPRADGVPIALITSSDDRHILARGLQAGADDFLSKPVNAVELRTRVRSLLRSKRLADELRGAQRETRRPSTPGPSHDQLAAACDRSKPLIAIVEDIPHDRRLLEANLPESDFAIRTAASAAEGVALVRQSSPDLVVLDLMLPDRDGFELIADLKRDESCAHVPILVVSGMADLSDRVRALEIGADDFIVKGFDRLEFDARVRRLLRLKRSLDQLSSRCNEAMRQAATDSLTGLYTHGFMQETLQRQLQLAKRHGQNYAAIFADIDFFKQTNDTHGHAAGDRVLRAVAETLTGMARASDTLVRYGGEEFVVLLPQTNGEQALVLAERIRQAVAALSIPIGDEVSIRVTMSLGVASYPKDASDGQTLVQRGDAAMYLAKRSGRNRSVLCGAGLQTSCVDARVLIVGDHDPGLSHVEDYLAAEGYRLLRAPCEAEALELCHNEPPDLVLMDAALPRQAALEVCRHLKQDSRTQSLPVLIVTSPGARDDMMRAIEAGADEFISKPIDRIELNTRVRTLVRVKRDMDVLEDAETIVFALARAVEDRDPLLANHMERVADSAVMLGKALGLNGRDLKALWRAGRAHDIGKIAVPDSILFKPGPLSDDERSIIQEHPDKGYRLLVPLRTFSDALPAVRFHHERLDGSGYPLGLRGDEVPRLAQILAVADVYDALTGRRHYRDAMSQEEAFQLLLEEAGRGLHDSAIVAAFIGAITTHQAEPDVNVGRAGHIGEGL